MVVAGKGGWRGIVHSWFGERPAEGKGITIRLDSGETIVVADSALSGRPDGSYYVPLSLEEIRQAAAPDNRGPLVIPVVEEELHVDKRKVETGAGVRVKKTSHEVEETADLPLIHEQVEVERVRIDKTVDGPVPVRHVGDTIIVPVMEEVLVVEKRLRLVEEVHIRKKRTETRQPQTVVLKKEEVIVERLEGTPEDRRNDEESQGETDDLRPV